MRTLFVGVLLSLATTISHAQAPQGPPKPSAEHQKLAAFVGNWTFTGEMKPGPMGPGGKMTGSDQIQWLPGNFFVERRFQGKSPMGEMRGLEIMGYDEGKKAHTYNYFDNMGMSGAGTLTQKGDVWSVSGTGNMGGKAIPERCTLTFGAGGTTLKIMCEMSMEGKWAPTFEGTATKAK